MVTRSSRELAMVTEDVVRSEPRPEFTKTWHPFSHSEVIDALELSCEKLGWHIGEREYSIRKDSKCLAVWEITNGGLEKFDGYSNRLVWRNAIDMTHSLAFGIAQKVVVCSNLMISNVKSWVTFRKHTGQLSIEEISFYAEESLKALEPRYKEFGDWHNSLRETPLSYEQASMLTLFAVKRGYLPTAKIPEFWENYQGERSLYKDHANTLYAFVQANTQLMRENNMLTQLDKQVHLHYFLQYEVPELMRQSNDPKIMVVNPKEAIDIGFKNATADREKENQRLKETSQKMRETWKEKVEAEKPKKEEKKKVEKKSTKPLKTSTVSKPKDTTEKKTKSVNQTSKSMKKTSGNRSQKKQTQTVKVQEMKSEEPTRNFSPCSYCNSLVEFKGKDRICPSCGESNA